MGTFGNIFGNICQHLGTFGNIVKALRGQRFRTFWEHFGTSLGTFLGTILNIWEHFCWHLGTFGLTPWLLSALALRDTMVYITGNTP